MKSYRIVPSNSTFPSRSSILSSCAAAAPRPPPRRRQRISATALHPEAWNSKPQAQPYQCGPEAGAKQRQKESEFSFKLSLEFVIWRVPGASRGGPGGSRGGPGPCWSLLGQLGGSWGASWGHLGPSWAVLGGVLGCLGGILRPLGAILGPLGHILVPLGPSSRHPGGVLGLKNPRES